MDLKGSTLSKSLFVCFLQSQKLDPGLFISQASMLQPQSEQHIVGPHSPVILESPSQPVLPLHLPTPASWSHRHHDWLVFTICKGMQCNHTGISAPVCSLPHSLVEETTVLPVSGNLSFSSPSSFHPVTSAAHFSSSALNVGGGTELLIPVGCFHGLMFPFLYVTPRSRIAKSCHRCRVD